MSLTVTPRQEPQVVLVTGASSGIGLSTARLLAEKGYKVYGTVRASSHTEALDALRDVRRVTLDVTDQASVTRVVQEILAIEGRIDVLINNAGYALVGTVESCTFEEQMANFDTNVWGPVRLFQAVLPSMRQRKSGRIINISSVVATAPYAYLEIYSATKTALNGLSESMRVSLHPFNIKVSVIEPGGVRTPAAEKSPIGTRDPDDTHPYREFLAKGYRQCRQNLAQGDSPDELAALVEEVIRAENPDFRYLFGSFAKAQAEKKYREPSGNTMIAEQIARL